MLALFLRSIREETRLRSTYWMRAALVVLVLLEIAAVHLIYGWVGAPGLTLFATVSGFNLFFITLAGLSYFSSAITEEKEEMTLGLLRMTSLSPLAILLGKSTSRLCGALFLLAAQFPFTLLSIALGGVTYEQILAAYVSLGAYVFLFANIALLFSVVARRTAIAAIWTGLTMLGLHLLPELITGVIWVLGRLTLVASPQPGPWLETVLARWNDASSFARLDVITATGFVEGPWSWQVTSNVGLGLVAFAVAWAAFRRFADRTDESPPARAWVGRKRSSLNAPGRAWSRAVLWKDFYFMGGGKFAFGLRLLLGAAIATFCSSRHWKKHSPWEWFDIGLMIAGIATAFLLVELAVAASRIFRIEHKHRTLSSLAQLPVSAGALARQKISAALLVALPHILMAGVGLSMTLPQAWRSLARMLQQTTPFSWRGFETFAGVTLAIFFSLVLLLHLIAWLSLRVKWGALPLAFGLWTVGIQVATTFAFLLFRGAPWAIATGGFLITGILFVNIGNRLEQLAAAD